MPNDLISNDIKYLGIGTPEIAPVAIVFGSEAKQAKNSVVAVLFSDKSHTPIHLGGAVVNTSAHIEDSQKARDYLNHEPFESL